MHSHFTEQKLVADYTAVEDQSLVWPDGPDGQPSLLATIVKNEAAIVGIPNLTDDTVDKFYYRSIMVSRVRGTGPHLTKKGETVDCSYSTYELLLQMRGTYTNAKEMSDAEFNEFCLNWLRDTAERRLQESIRPRNYLAKIRVTRLRPSKELYSTDRALLFNGTPGKVKVFTHSIQKPLRGSIRELGKKALQEFHDIFFNKVEKPDDFEVQLIKLEPTEG